MAILFLALLTAFAFGTVMVLADSGMRLWSAMGGLKAQHRALSTGQIEAPKRSSHVTMRISYARSVTALGRVRPAPLRVAA